MTRLTRERLLRGGLATVLLGGVLTATFGAGYRSSEALLDGASAWLPRGHDVVRVNAETEDVDAEVARELADGSERLAVVEVRPGVVYVVNTDTNEVWRMPTDTLQPEPVDRRPEAGGQLEMAAGGDRAYLLNPADGSMALMEDASGSARTEVALPERAPITELVVDSAGVAWALSVERGQLYAIDGATLAAQHPVSEPGEPARLTLADDQPVVYLPEQGLAASYGRPGRVREVTLPAETVVEVAAPGADAPVLVTVVRRTGELVTVDLGSGASARLALVGRERHRFGPPVVAHGRVYVPDYTNRHLVVVELDPLRQDSYERVPGELDFDLFARDGRVWASDPYHPMLLSFDRNGRPTQIDKGTGEEAPEPDPGRPEPPPVEQPPQPPPVIDEPEPPTGERVRVPDVVGLDRVAACAKLKEVKLNCEFAPKPAADGESGEGGKVLSTDPRAGERLPVDSTVTITFRALPRPAVPPPGRTLEETCAAVQAATLTCRSVPYPGQYATSTDDLHQVVSYEPAAGTELEVGAEVRVEYLEKPPTIAVPDLSGQEATVQACATLQKFFLQCAPNAGEVHWQVNVVHGQNIPAGTPVAVDTAVEYVYAPSYPTPVPLTRYHFEGPNGYQPAWNLTTVGPPGPNWKGAHQFGGVYQPGETAVPGLVQIYEATCTVGCGVKTMYFYTRRHGHFPGRPVVGDAQYWSMPSTPAFSCFADPVSAETRPLVKMYSPDKQAWFFAIEGTEDFQLRRSNGFQHEGVLCHVWYGVPPFPGS
jgi:beta-lactam-binding protein with PASTA domain